MSAKEEGPLKDTIKKVISNLEKKEKEGIDIAKTWEKTVDPKSSKHSKPAFLRAKRLVVNVSDSAWLYKLTLEKDKLMKKFNNNMKGKKIRQLQFRIGDIVEDKGE